MKFLDIGWREHDGTLDLKKVMIYFDHTLIEEKGHYSVFGFGKDRFIVLSTSAGDRYYRSYRPEVKLTAFDFVLDRLSKMEDRERNDIWSKVDVFYSRIAEEGLVKVGNPENGEADNMFNHFREYGERFALAPFRESDEVFKDRLFKDGQGNTVYPLYNLTNTLTGYVRETEKGTVLIGDSDSSASIWFSNIPGTFERMFVFASAGEAEAFHNRFGFENAVYVVLDKINYDTTKILTEIYKRSKIAKIGLSFTGSSKMVGYISDLMMLSFINDTNFLMRVEPDHVSIRFNPETEKQLTRTYKEIKKYNAGITNGFLRHNPILEQTTVNRKLIVLGRSKDMIEVRLPFDITAIRYFLWSYYRNYMAKMIEVLKPKASNWRTEFRESGSYNGKDMEDVHKIAV